MLLQVQVLSFRVSQKDCWRGICSKPAVPKVIYTASDSSRGFINAMLAPVNCRHEPRFGVRQTLWITTLTFGMVALMRLLLAN